MDVSTIRTRARLLVNEPTSGGFWTDANYLSAINEAQDDVALRTRCLKTYAAFSTSASTSEYSIAEASLSNFIDIAEVWYFIDDDNYRVLTSVSRDELSYLQSQNLARTGYPEYYCYEDRVIEFDCDTEASKTVRVYYFKLPTALDSDDDVSLIPTKFHQALIYYTCWKFCESDGLDPNRTLYFKNQYIEEIGKINMTLKTPASTYPGIKDDTMIIG